MREKFRKKFRDFPSATPSSQRVSSRHVPGAPRIAALVWVDEAPLRKQTSWEFKKIYQSYLELREELEHHQENVRPAYYRWVTKLFNERMSELEKLHSEVVRRSALLQRMIQLFVMEDRSKASAFQQAQEELEEILREREEDEKAFRENAEKEHESQETAQETDEEEPEADSYRFEEPSFHEIPPSARRQEAEQSVEARIKFLYRKLAQALHPDLAGPQSELAREMWLDTQSAYQAGDLEQLEVLWTMLSLEKDPQSTDVALSSLKNAMAAMNEKLQAAKRDKGRLARKDPSWGFEKKSKAKFEAKIRRDLEHEEFALNDALTEIESEMQSFARSAETRRKGRSKGRRGRDQQTSFDF